MSAKAYKILLAIALAAFALTRILPRNPMLHMGTGLFLTVLLLIALYRFYIDSGRRHSFLVVFVLCLVLEAASLALLVIELVG